jgi:hypothetical protein
MSPWPSSPTWGSIWYRIRRAHGDSFYTTLCAIDYHREFALWFMVASSLSLERVKSASEITPCSFNSDTCQVARVCSTSMHSYRGCPLPVLQKHSLNYTLLMCLSSTSWSNHITHNHSVACTFQYFSIGSHCPLFSLIKYSFKLADSAETEMGPEYWWSLLAVK